LVLPINEVGDIPKIKIYVRFSPVNARGGEIESKIVHASGGQELILPVRGTEEIITLNQNSIRQNILIYPNPVESKLNIELLEVIEIKYELIGLNGVTILEGQIDTSEQLDLQEIEIGVYLLKLKYQNEALFLKIVKK
jgi:hypothetical protein